MQIVCIPVSLVKENVYICYDEESLEGVIIDPGSNPDAIIRQIKDKEITVKGILLTHGHFDHISAVPRIKKYSGAQVYACAHEERLLGNPDLNLSSVALRKEIRLKADVYLQDGDEITFGKASLRVIHTPGHTVGSICFYSEEELVLFAGDTLFAGTIGRTDFPTSNMEVILQSVRGTLAALPDAVLVYPGHGEHTTIAKEKERNPYLVKVKSPRGV